MFKITNKQILAENVKRIDIIAPNIARKIQPGQFVSVCPEEDDEQIPMTVTSRDPIKGQIALTFPEIGQTTKKLGALPINETLFSVLGPLGRPANIQKEGVVICIATGIGTAQILPICQAYKEKNNKIIGIIGAKTKTTLMLEAQMRIVCDKILIATEDGSYERKGLATDLLEQVLDQSEIHCVYAIGSVAMMRKVCALTKARSLKTLVKLNPIMTDCMGMCGSCRVKVDGKELLACIDGPEFDGHKVDYDDLALRMNAYEESKEWGNQPLKRNPDPNESRTLTRFLSGIPKN